jgi:hypothetical protein
MVHLQRLKRDTVDVALYAMLIVELLKLMADVLKTLVQ